MIIAFSGRYCCWRVIASLRAFYCPTRDASSTKALNSCKFYLIIFNEPIRRWIRPTECCNKGYSPILNQCRFFLFKRLSFTIIAVFYHVLNKLNRCLWIQLMKYCSLMPVLAFNAKLDLRRAFWKRCQFDAITWNTSVLSYATDRAQIMYFNKRLD